MYVHDEKQNQRVHEAEFSVSSVVKIKETPEMFLLVVKTASSIIHLVCFRGLTFHSVITRAFRGS